MTIWTRPGLDERLTELVKAKVPRARIAGILNAEFGLDLTKNGVIGRSHRLGLQQPLWREEERLARDLARQARKPRVVKLKRQEAVVGARVKENDALGCRWIESDPRIDTTPCGKPRQLREGGGVSPYCPAHHARAFEPNVRRADPAPALQSRGMPF